MGENKLENVDKTISFIDRIGKMLKKWGLQNILLFIMVLFLTAAASTMLLNPESIYNKMEQIKQKSHTESVMKRINNEPRIRENLVNLKAELKADRVFVLETHNGGTNLSNLPFLYVDLTYAEPRAQLAWMEDEYKNVRLSRHPWATEVFKNTYWSGEVESLELLDPELYHRLKNEDVVFFAAVMMFGTYNPSGVLGVVYTSDEHPDDEVIRRIIFRYSSSLAILFNNE